MKLKENRRTSPSRVRAASARQPLVSCLMVSRGNLFPAEMAIACYQRQTYANRELIIVSAQPDNEVARHVADLNDSSIRYIQSAPRPLGELRNQSVAASHGELMCTWDDDDLYDERRIEWQVQGCLKSRAAAHFMDRLLLWWPDRRLLAISRQRPWENSMMVRREALPAYPPASLREDSHVVEQIRSRHKIATSDEPEFYCYVVNSNNSCDHSHFERLFEQAEWIYPDYDAELVRLTARYPVRAYADGLVAKVLSRNGEIARPPGRPALTVCSEHRFGSEDLQVDGMHFRNCAFEGTRFFYLGGAFPVFENCPMDKVGITFLGSAANTVNWLRQLKMSGLLVDGL